MTYLVGTAGVRQFLDIGTGLPTAGNNPGLRHSGRGADSAPQTALADLPTDHSYLDIPAFLRRQAD